MSAENTADYYLQEREWDVVRGAEGLAVTLDEVLPELGLAMRADMVVQGHHNGLLPVGSGDGGGGGVALWLIAVCVAQSKRSTQAGKCKNGLGERKY